MFEAWKTKPNAEKMNEKKTVDILKPTKLIKEFREFNKDFDAVIKNPDYKFQIDRIISLVREEEEVELVGRAFRSEVLSCCLQIKCVVRSDEFQLFIAFLEPKKDGGHFPIEIPLRLITAIKAYSPLKFCYNFPETLSIVWGTFYPFCKFSYDKKIKSILNWETVDCSITLHFLMKDSRSRDDVLVKDGILNWKVDALLSKLNSGVVVDEEDELGLSPVFHKEPNGMRVQVRLFTRGTKGVVQVNFWNETDEILEYSLIDFKIFHPKKLTRNIHFAFDPLEHQLKEMEARDRSFVSFQFAKVEELIPFIDRFLLVRIKI